MERSNTIGQIHSVSIGLVMDYSQSQVNEDKCKSSSFLIRDILSADKTSTSTRWQCQYRDVFHWILNQHDNNINTVSLVNNGHWPLNLSSKTDPTQLTSINNQSTMAATRFYENLWCYYAIQQHYYAIQNHSDQKNSPTTHSANQSDDSSVKAIKFNNKPNNLRISRRTNKRTSKPKASQQPIPSGKHDQRPISRLMMKKTSDQDGHEESSATSACSSASSSVVNSRASLDLIINMSKHIAHTNHNIHRSNIKYNRKIRRNRTVFTELQLMGLERRFDSQKYLSTPDRTDLARALGLTQLQVKTWYQNRRMKWKKQVMQNGCPYPPTKPKGRPKKDSIPTYGIEFTNSILCPLIESQKTMDN